MKRATNIILLFLLPTLLSAQQPNLDSLWAVSNDENQPDKIRLEALKECGTQLLYINLDSALVVFKKMQEFASEIKDIKALSESHIYYGVINTMKGDYETALSNYKRAEELFVKMSESTDSLIKKEGDKGIGMVYTNMAVIQYYQSKYDLAIKMYKKGFNHSIKNNDDIKAAAALSNIGSVYLTKGEYPKALDYYLKCKNTLEALYKKNPEHPDIFEIKQGIANCYNNIANIHQEQGKLKLATQHLNTGIKFDSEIKNASGIAYAYDRLGSIFNAMEEYDSALFALDTALNLYGKLGNKDGKSNTLLTFGEVYRNIKNYDSAKVVLNQAISLLTELGNKASLSSAFGIMGSVYNATKDYQKAEKYCMQAFLISDSLGNNHINMESCKCLSWSYEKQNRFKPALNFYKKYKLMTDQLFNDEKSKEIGKIEAKSEYDKEQLIQNEKHLRELELAAEKEKRQQVVSYAAGGGLLLVLVFAVFIFNRFRVSQKQKVLIEKQKEVVEEKNREIIDSINYAKRLQEAILPPQKLVKEYLQQSFILYKPKDIVAGDFYWMETVDDTVYFAAADCTGHGVPGAMVSVVCSNALSKALIEENITDVGKLLDRTRELVVERFGRSEENIQDGMDIALCSLTFNVSGSKLEEQPETSNLKPETKAAALLHYAGANNPLWIIRKGATEVEETKADKQPIGKYDKEDPFTSHSIELQKGDTLYIFSDGYPDQFGGPKGKKYKTGAMKKFLLSIQEKDMATQRELLNEEFESWKGELEQIDDVCVIGVRV